MSQPSNVVSLHPYFKSRPGKLEAIRAMLPAFVAKTATEKLCLYYDFLFNGDELACREAYVGAEGVQAHLVNVGELLNEMLKISDVIRLEVQGPAAELEKLKKPLTPFNPAWFVHECGVTK